MAASRYRVLQHIPYLQAKGVETKVLSYPRSLGENWRFFESLPYFDIVFLQRKRPTSWRLWLLRKRANRIVFDFDDSIMYRNFTAENPISKWRQRRFIRILKASDVEELAESIAFYFDEDRCNTARGVARQWMEKDSPTINVEETLRIYHEVAGGGQRLRNP